MSDRIAEIRARLAAATPGPKKIYDGWGPANDGLCRAARIGSSSDTVLAAAGDDEIKATEGDFELIAMASDDIAYLLTEVERLRAALDEMETAEAPCGHLERWWKVEPNQDAWCVMCTLEKLNDTAAVYLTMLREIEWVNVLVQNDADPDYPDWCPWCFNIREQGHARHCPRAALEVEP